MRMMIDECADEICVAEIRTESKAAVRRSIMLANFCGRGLVSWENRPMKSLNHDTRHFSCHEWRQKMTDDKYAHASMLLAIVTAKQHKKRTVWVRRWICWSCLKLTGQRISACNCIYQLRGSDITGLSCKQTVSQSQLGILGTWAIFSSRIERVLLGQ